MEQISALVAQLRAAIKQEKFSLLDRDLLLDDLRQCYREAAAVNVDESAPEQMPTAPVNEQQTAQQEDATTEQNSVPEHTTLAEKEAVEQTPESAAEQELAQEETTASEEEMQSNQVPEPEEHDTEIADEDTAETGEEETSNPHATQESDSFFADTEYDDFEVEPELKAFEQREEKPYDYTDFKVWHKDIRTYIGINDKYNFISELFGGNAEAYDEILTAINQQASIDKALEFLENAGVTTLYKWEDSEISAENFQAILSQFFASR